MGVDRGRERCMSTAGKCEREKTESRLKKNEGEGKKGKVGSPQRKRKTAGPQGDTSSGGDPRR